MTTTSAVSTAIRAGCLARGPRVPGVSSSSSTSSAVRSAKPSETPSGDFGWPADGSTAGRLRRLRTAARRSVEEAGPALGPPGIAEHARQEDAELAPHAGLAAGRDLAAEEAHAACDQRQADAQTVVAPGRLAVALREEVEDLLQTLGLDADAGVAHGDGGPIRLTGADSDHDL